MSGPNDFNSLVYASLVALTRQIEHRLPTVCYQPLQCVATLRPCTSPCSSRGVHLHDPPFLPPKPTPHPWFSSPRHAEDEGRALSPPLVFFCPLLPVLSSAHRAVVPPFFSQLLPAPLLLFPSLPLFLHCHAVPRGRLFPRNQRLHL